MSRHTSLDTIQDFLAQKRIAMVGVSRDPKDFSVMLFQELSRRGYDVVPVNPGASEILGRPCFARVSEIQPPVDAVLLMTAPVVTESIVRDCAHAGIGRVWMYSAGGAGAVSEKALEVGREHGIRVVAGECPFMFFPHPGWHVVHGFVRRIMGSYPRHADKQAA